MKRYQVLKPLYNERAGRVLQPGEIWPFDDRQAEVLVERKCITGDIVVVRRKTAPPDPELEKLQDNL